MDQVGECKLPHPHPFSGPVVHLLHPLNCRRFIWFGNRFLLGAVGVVHHLDLWNIRHIAHRILMGAWLFKTPVGPQAHYLNPLQFYTIKKEKAELGSFVQEAKPCGIGKYSTTSSVASMARGMIYWAFLFRFGFIVLFRIFQESEIYANSWYQSSYLCLGVLYVVSTVGFSLCVWIVNGRGESL